MKYEIGDKVILLHSREEGHIIEFLNEEMVMVEVEGIPFPVYLDQIDHPYFYRFEKGRPENANKKKRIKGEDIPMEKFPHTERKEKGFWLSFLPVYQQEEDIVERFKIFIVNETAMEYHFHYQLFLMQEMNFEIKNQLPPFNSFYLNDLLFEDLNDLPRFELNLSPIPSRPDLEDNFKKVIKPKPKKVFMKLQGMRAKNEATFIYPLFDIYPPKKAPLQVELPLTIRQDNDYGTFVSTATVYPPIETARYEVDLHIEKLVADWRGMDNFEILMTQLQEFEKYLHLAIAQQQFSMIAIHGVGKGRLRNEIHEILKHTREVRNFVNQYDVRYGYGATEIFFEYKG